MKLISCFIFYSSSGVKSLKVVGNYFFYSVFNTIFSLGKFTNKQEVVPLAASVMLYTFLNWVFEIVCLWLTKFMSISVKFYAASLCYSSPYSLIILRIEFCCVFFCLPILIAFDNNSSSSLRASVSFLSKCSFSSFFRFLTVFNDCSIRSSAVKLLTSLGISFSTAVSFRKLSKSSVAQVCFYFFLCLNLLFLS